MLLVSELFGSSSSLIKTWKAPRGTMWKVDSLSIVVSDSSTASLVIVDYAFEDNVDPGSVSLAGIDALIFVTANALTQYRLTKMDHKAKFLSVLINTLVSTNFHVAIYGEIVSASRTDLILEWFRKGR